MTRQRVLLLLLVAGLVSLVFIGQAFSQQGRRGGRGGRGGAQTAEQRAERIEQWRAQRAEQLRESLGVTEAEWETLQPMIEEVQTLARQLRTGSAFGRQWRRRGGDDESTSDSQPQTDVEAAAQALQELVGNDTATVEDFEVAMEVLRAARAEVEAQVAAAQEALRNELTVRQQAQFMLQGLLD